MFHLGSWFRKQSNSAVARGRRPFSTRLRLECLEDRNLLAVVHFTIDPQQNAHAISRFIYGVNQSLDGNLANLTFTRLGGNRWTAYNWENNASNAGGAKGVTYDWLNISGTLDIAATSGSRFTIYVTSLDAGNAAGTAPGFVIGQSYQWILATASGGITNFNTGKFAIDTSAFLNDPTNVGGFTISQSGNSLVLNYTAVPEPSPYAIGVVALLGIAILLRLRGKVRAAH